MKLEQHLCGAGSEAGIVVFHALGVFGERVEWLQLLPHGAMGKDGRDALGGPDDPDHGLPGVPLKKRREGECGVIPASPMTRQLWTWSEMVADTTKKS